MLKVLGYLLAVPLLLMLIPLMLVFMVLFIMAFAIMWACGVPIKISVKDRVIGHLVRTKFIRA